MVRERFLPRRSNAVAEAGPGATHPPPLACFASYGRIAQFVASVDRLPTNMVAWES
jgi:hypothetical protein